MDIDTERILDLLALDDLRNLRQDIDTSLRKDIHSADDWKELVSILRVACSKAYQKHWLKTHQVILSVFEIPELLGVDCRFFEELQAIPLSSSLRNASDHLFDNLIEIAKDQLTKGGSTLFFNVDSISHTRSAIIASDLIEARFRETVLVLNEIDQAIPKLTKEWVNISRLWRTGNGYRLLKATDFGVVIHIKAYGQLRDLLLEDLDVDSDRLNELSVEFSESNYLQLSKTLDEFMTGLIASRGIRGTYEPHFKNWIDHEGLDDF
ncbi:MAG: hypothetical protein ACFFCP_10605 [Promethearchaeota archaeon]